MQPNVLFALLAGSLCVVAGAYVFARPMNARNWVRPREWQERPARAEAKQRRRATASGTVLVVIGLACFVAAARVAGPI